MTSPTAGTAPNGAGRPPSGVFGGANAAALEAADASHWWFRGKAEAVGAALRRWAPATGWLLDVGSGAGGVTAMLHWPVGPRLAVEGSAVLARAASGRGLTVVRSDVLQLPVRDGAVAAVCLLDVIEHLADPVAGLAEARRVLRPDGVVVVNVPGHRWLWSATDAALGHHRRYVRRLLARELDDAGLAPLWSSHLFGWCVAPAFVARRVVRPGTAELGIGPAGPLAQRAAAALNAAERRLLARATLPIGTSLLAVARPV